LEGTKAQVKGMRQLPDGGGQTKMNCDQEAKNSNKRDEKVC